MRPTLLRTLAATTFSALLVAGAVFVPVIADDPKPAPKAAAPKAVVPVPPEVTAKLELLEATHWMQTVAGAYSQYVGIHGKVPADVTDKAGKALLSWRVHLLPYMHQQNVHALVNFEKAWDSEENRAMSQVMLKAFLRGGDFPGAKPGNPVYWGTRVRRFAGPTGENAEFAVPAPGKPDLFANRKRFGESGFPCVAEVGAPVPWLKPDEDFEFDPSAKDVILPSLHAFGTLVATADGKFHLLRREPDAAAFADWMTKGAKAKIDPAKLYAPTGTLTDADRRAGELIRAEWQELTEARRKLEDRRLELRLELARPAAPAGDPDPLRMTRLLGDINSLRSNKTAEFEVRQLEEELKKREKK